MKSKQTHYFALLAIMIAIELTLFLTPLGFIQIGLIRVTTLHIPVIIAGILLGSKAGAVVGFVFGLCSVIINTIAPTPASFLFSPFARLGAFSGGIGSLIIAFIPRIFLGYFAGLIYTVLTKKSKSIQLNGLISAVASTLFHTISVLSLIAFFYGAQYCALQGIPLEKLASFLFGVIAVNGSLEVVVSAVVTSAIVSAVHFTYKRKENA